MTRAPGQRFKYHPFQPSFKKSLPTYTEFIESTPSLLSEGIQYFGFHLDTGHLDSMFILPDGCLDIVICCYPHQPSANICGNIVRRRKGIFVRPDCDYFAIRFLPGYAERFLKYPVSEFTENEIPLQDVLPHADRLLEAVATQSSFTERIRAFEAFHTEHYSSKLDTPALVEYLTEKIIGGKGTVPIGDLAADTGYSTRYMHKTFERYVGVSPKLFSRIIRFQHVLNALEKPRGAETLDGIMELGYFDQNHFIKEFKEFSAVTPTKYLKRSGLLVD